MSNAASPTSNPRKRTRWDIDDSQADKRQSSPPTRPRSKPKVEPAPPSPSPRVPVQVASASGSTETANGQSKPSSDAPLRPRKRKSRTKELTARDDHPPIAPSRSVYCYERLNQIEEGAYGVVFRAREKETGDIVALKKLKLDDEKHGFPITALREINALIRCEHENVVKVREVVVGETLTQCVYDVS